MESLGLDAADLENGIIEGEVLKKQRDERRQARFKYSISGPAISGRVLYFGVKVKGKKVKAHLLIMTVHWADED